MTLQELDQTIECLRAELARIDGFSYAADQPFLNWHNSYVVELKAINKYHTALRTAREHARAEAPRPAVVPLEPVLLTRAEVYAHFKLPPPPVPLPDVVQLQQQKKWKITRHLDKPGAWGRTEEGVLRSYLNQPRSPATKDFIKSYRRKRKNSTAGLSYRVARGPVAAQERRQLVPDAAPPLELLRSVYYFARKQASHKRTASRHLDTGGGEFGERVGLVYLKPGAVLSRLRAEARQGVYREKVPKSRLPHVGLELEFSSRASKHALGAALFERGLLQHVQLKEDGSVRSTYSGDSQHELCILAPEKALQDVVEGACAALKQFKSTVNPSCGLHVHLDMRQRRPDVCYARLLASLDILYALVPRDRWYNTYCRRNQKSATWAQALEVGGGGERSERYLAINALAYARHKTIEIRLHAGTLTPSLILGWTTLLLFIISTPNSVSYKDPEKFIRELGVPPALATYIRERYAYCSQDNVEREGEHLDILGRRPIGGTCECSTCASMRDESRYDYVPPDDPASRDLED